MTRYWFTTHWPHPASPAEDVPYFIYPQPRYRKKGELISPGDRVLFYETAGGKGHRKDDRVGIVALKKGRQAVIGCATVTGPIRPNSTGLKVAGYEDGSRKDWGWEVPSADHEWGRPVPYEQVLKVLDRGTVRIPGGLIEIDRQQFETLREMLRR